MKSETKTITWGTVAVIILILILMFGIPIYKVWQQKLAGQAKLANAEFGRMVLVAQAHAELEAAKLQAQAIMTVGKAAKEYPEYRQQEFIRSFGHALESGKISQIIYVPTEANIPIVEMGRIAASWRK